MTRGPIVLNREPIGIRPSRIGEQTPAPEKARYTIPDGIADGVRQLAEYNKNVISDLNHLEGTIQEEYTKSHNNRAYVAKQIDFSQNGRTVSILYNREVSKFEAVGHGAKEDLKQITNALLNRIHSDYLSQTPHYADIGQDPTDKASQMLIASKLYQLNQQPGQTPAQAVQTVNKLGASWLNREKARLGFIPPNITNKVSSAQTTSTSATVNQNMTQVTTALGGDLNNLAKGLLRSNPQLLAEIAMSLPRLDSEQRRLLKNALQSGDRDKVAKLLSSFNQRVEASTASAQSRRR